jgi:hypothetical protein
VRGAPSVVDPYMERLPAQLVVEWKIGSVARRPFCFRLHPATATYGVEHVLDGYQRPSEI